MYLKMVDGRNVNNLPVKNNSLSKVVYIELKLYMIVLLHVKHPSLVVGLS